VKFTFRCILILLVFASSCAKEVYTNEDATNSKRESQKVGLTVMIRDISNQAKDLSGFVITSSQCGEDIQEVTSAAGIANLMVVKGDVVLQVYKAGYVSVTAVATTNATEKERNNTVVIVPVFADVQTSGSLYGMVSVKSDASTIEPLANALVSIDMDMNELIRISFPDMGGNVEKYLPGAWTYSSANLMQPVRTNVLGEFNIAIPATVADLTYTVNVHETVWTQNTFCSANLTVVTNGLNCPVVFFQLMPYEKN
jgi:hypothetical protein